MKTPETDAFYGGCAFSADHARKLEIDRDRLKRELAESEEAYETLTTLLRNRFPRNADGSLPDFKIEDVLWENNHLRTTRVKPELDPEMVFDNELGWMHVIQQQEFKDIKADRDAWKKCAEMNNTAMNGTVKRLRSSVAELCGSPPPKFDTPAPTMLDNLHAVGDAQTEYERLKLAE